MRARCPVRIQMRRIEGSLVVQGVVLQVDAVVAQIARFCAHDVDPQMIQTESCALLLFPETPSISVIASLWPETFDWACFGLRGPPGIETANFAPALSSMKCSPAASG